MKKMLQKLQTASFFRFLLVGGCSTGIDFILYFLLSWKMHVTISKGISMIVSSLFSYVANKRFTFEDRRKTNAGYLAKFYVVFALNFGANLGVNYILYQKTGYKLVAYVFATVVGMTVNYLGQKLWVFDDRNKSG